MRWIHHRIVTVILVVQRALTLFINISAFPSIYRFLPPNSSIELKARFMQPYPPPFPSPSENSTILRQIQFRMFRAPLLGKRHRFPREHQLLHPFISRSFGVFDFLKPRSISCCCWCVRYVYACGRSRKANQGLKSEPREMSGIQVKKPREGGKFWM